MVDLANDILQLDDLVYTYPAQKQPGFQTLISAKEEFRQLASSISENTPTRGGLYKHQELVKRFMLIYDLLLLIHRTGTGKSCAAFGTSEQFKRGIIASTVNFIEDYLLPQKTHIKRIIVLTKGPSLVSELKRELVNSCAPGVYETEAVRRSITPAARKNNITRAIKKYYTIETHGAFVSGILKLGLTDEQIREAYSGTLFIIDEAHNLQSEPNERASGSSEDEEDESINESTVRKHEKGQNYRQLHRIFHLIERSKIMLLTATPMINDVREVAPLMNLILPLDMQIPTDDSLNLATVSLNTMEPYFRGLISYVRELDTGAVPTYVGNPLETIHNIGGINYPSQMVVYGSYMSAHQFAGYSRVVNTTNGVRARNSFYIRERQASNFIFPDGSSGTSTPREIRLNILRGFLKYVTRRGNDDYAPTDELLEYISNRDGLSQLSNKYLSIVELCRESPGNCFCYSDFLDTGSILLGLCFEYLGENPFQRFNSSSSIFTYTGPARTGDRIVNISPRPRYALLTSETSDAQAATILEAFNSYENRYGDYIKVIIGSPVTRIGINLANVRQIHLVGPSWNQSNTYQALSRAIRSTSHNYLIDEEVSRLVREGYTPEEARLRARVIVNIYQHASLDPTGGSIDIDMYRLSEEKDIEIKRMERMMKQVSIDCQIHYRRNVRPQTDLPRTPACDYSECEYKCFDRAPRNDEIDYSSFDVLYSNDIINSIIEDIRVIFNTNFYLSFERLYGLLSQYRRKYIDLAVEKMYTEKISIVDRFGYSQYLRESGKTLYLQKEYPALTPNIDNYALTTYGQNLVGTAQTKLSDYLSLTQINDQVRITEDLERVDPNSDEFSDLLDSLNLDSKVKFVEDWILNFVNNPNDPRTSSIVQNIVNKYGNFIYGNVHEPVNAIERSRDKLAKKGKGRGRKSKPGTKAKVEKIKLEQLDQAEAQTDTEEVFLHILYILSFDRTGYAVTSKINKGEARTRLLKPSEGTGWRDVRDYEFPAYNAIIQSRNTSRISTFEDNPIYGIITPDGKFKIRDKTNENREEVIRDRRKPKRGRTCDSWGKFDLIEVLWKLKIQPDQPPASIPGDTQIRNNLIRINKVPDDRVRDYNTERLRFYYSWFNGGSGKKQICDKIRRYFEDNNMMRVE